MLSTMWYNFLFISPPFHYARHTCTFVHLHRDQVSKDRALAVIFAVYIDLNSEVGGDIIILFILQ